MAGARGRGHHRRALGRVAAIAVVLALVVVSLTACAPSNVHVVGHRAAVSAGASTVLVAPDGPTVTVPAGAVRGDGELSVTNVRRGGLAGWTIALAHTTLRSTVTLSFPIPAAAKGAQLMIGYSEPPSTALHLVSGTRSGDRYVVRTGHFSFWTDVASTLHDKVLGWLVDQLSTVQVDAPSCTSFDTLAAAGWRQHLAPTKVALDCVGGTSDGSAPQVRVTNRLGVPLELDVLPGLTVEPSTVSLDDELGKLLTEMSANPLLPTAKPHFLASGETAVLDSDGATTSGALMLPSGSALLAGVLLTAVKTLLLVDGWGGGTATEQSLLEALDSEDCLIGLETAATKSTPTDGASAVRYLLGLVPSVFSCMKEHIEDLGVGGILAGAVGDLVEWVGSVAASAAQVNAAALATLYEPKGAEADVFAPGSTSTSLGLATGSAPATGPVPLEDWQSVGGATLQATSAGFSVGFDGTYWGGAFAQLPANECDYTFSAEARVTGGDGGYGMGVHASIADGTPTADSIQYDIGAGGYRDTVLPGESETGTIDAKALDDGWHTVTVTANGSTVTSTVDGTRIFSGTTSTGCGKGLFIRVWNGTTAEFRDVTVTQH